MRVVGGLTYFSRYKPRTRPSVKQLKIALIGLIGGPRGLQCQNNCIYCYRMNYGPRTKTPSHSMGTPSIYSHMTRSTTNLKSTRSMKSLKIKWYQKPIVQDAIIMDIQRGAMYTAIYSIVRGC